MRKWIPYILIGIFLNIGIYLWKSTGPEISQTIADSRETAITRAIEIISPSVVSINVTQLKQKAVKSYWNPFFFPYAQTYKVDNLGSGVIITHNGYIITNAHVVENAHEIVVTLMGGQRFDASVVGYDHLTDVAVLKIKGENLPQAKLGDSEDLSVGEWAIALGNPLGLFDVSHQPTATAGIVSGINMDFGQKDEGHVYQDMIQTDASINPGNSGGPLVNALGEVIGINTFIITGSKYSTGSIGIAFSIPINRVKDVVSDIRKYGKVQRSYTTGIQVQDVDKFIQRLFRLTEQKGVLIRDVEKRSSGDRAGLKPGDVILKIDGRKVNTRSDISRIIDEGFHKVGDKITLSIWRASESMDVELELEEPKSKTWGF